MGSKNGSKIIGNFIVSETSNGIVINDKHGSWQIKFADGTNYHMAIDLLLKNQSKNELEVLLNVMFYATATCAVDIGLVMAIVDYFKKTNNPKKSEDTDDARDLKIVKETQKLKDEQNNDEIK